MQRLSKHDSYLEAVCNRIRSEYDEVSINVPLFSRNTRKKNILAEIDILARKGDHYDVYEVKCSYRIYKARKQLSRIKRILPQVRNTFFFCGESGTLEEIVV